MREIKFRFWDPHNKNMHYQEKKYTPETQLKRFFVNYHGHYKGGNNPKLMQYTGLKDKGGTEIYEGDIVIWNDGGGEAELNPEKGWIRKAVVKIDPDIQFQLTKDTPSGEPGYVFKYASFICTDTHNHLKVISNIYENPELIED